MPPARTGTARSSRIAVISMVQQNRGISYKVKPGALIFRIVVMKFIAPRIELIPDR